MMLRKLIYVMPLFAALAVNAGLKFEYKMQNDALFLEVTAEGESAKGVKWRATSVTAEDIPYLQMLFSNETVMAGFAAGQPRDPHATAVRVVKSWMPRFMAGEPNSGLTLWDVTTEGEHKRIGHCVAGSGEGKGVTEIAMSLMEEDWNGEGTPAIWKQGVMESVGEIFLKEWVPTVVSWGRNKGAPSKLIASRFGGCFDGSPLCRVDMTCNPLNQATFSFSSKHFDPADFKVEEQTPVANFSTSVDMTPKAVQEALIALYDEALGENALEKGKRYRAIGPDGKLLTFSHHARYKTLKYHWELNVRP